MFKIARTNKEVAFVGEYGPMYSKNFSQNMFYEQDFLDYISSLQLEGSYLDIGGNIGNHALYFAIFCNSTVVHTFEPLEKYQRYITDNIRANSLEKKVVLHPYALADSSMPVSFDMGGQKKVVTNIMTLDGLEISMDNSVCCIKIDVEGNEERVLKGGLETIKRHKPVLFIEVVEEPKLRRIDQLLYELGYHRTKNVFNGSPTYEWVIA